MADGTRLIRRYLGTARSPRHGGTDDFDCCFRAIGLGFPFRIFEYSCGSMYLGGQPGGTFSVGS
jgi:hypothetical protein